MPPDPLVWVQCRVREFPPLRAIIIPERKSENSPSNCRREGRWPAGRFRSRQTLSCTHQACPSTPQRQHSSPNNQVFKEYVILYVRTCTYRPSCIIPGGRRWRSTKLGDSTKTTNASKTPRSCARTTHILQNRENSDARHQSAVKMLGTILKSAGNDKQYDYTRMSIIHASTDSGGDGDRVGGPRHPGTFAGNPGHTWSFSIETQQWYPTMHTLCAVSGRNS